MSDKKPITTDNIPAWQTDEPVVMAEPEPATAAHKMRVSGPDTYGYYRTRCDCGWCGGPWSRRGAAVAEYERHLTDGR